MLKINIVKLKFIIILFASMLFVSCQSQKNISECNPSKVELKRNDKNQNRLYVNDKEFFVHGAGIEFGYIKALAECGGNSFRTWHTDNEKHDAIELLDDAYKNGLMVLMGLEVARERHGFDYNDSIKVQKQYDYIKGEVERLKNHPALLGWAIGNELNLGAKNLKVYDAVNDISKMIHEIDPNHVTTTTLAGIGKRETDYIKTNCTDIDFLSIQLYGEIINLQKHLDEAGWHGPYIVSEWGATGHWEVERTEWDVAIEQTSKEKAEAFIDRYNKAIIIDEENCLGSYVFLWGQKQERTPTWYGMFLENGSKTETVDAMQYVWTGKWPENRCPTIDSFKIDNKTAFNNIKLIANTIFNAEVFYRNYEKDSLTFVWEILPESADLGLGGDFEERSETILSINASNNVEVIVPEKEGEYRLFVYIEDENKNAATANIPFMVINNE